MPIEELIGILFINKYVFQDDVKTVKVKDIVFKTSHKEKKTTSNKIYEFVDDNQIILT